MIDCRNVFEDAMEDFPDDHDSAKAQMVKEGVPFKSVTRVFNQLMVETGRTLSKDSKDKFIKKIISRGVKTEKGFNSRVDELMAKIPGTTERSAGAAIRYFCKANRFSEIYKRPARNVAPRVSFTKQFCDYVIANPNIDEGDIMDYLMDGTANYVKRNFNNYMEIWRMAQCLRNSS
jgi:hypothetical protein